MVPRKLNFRPILDESFFSLYLNLLSGVMNISYLEILGLLLMVPGAVTIYLAKMIVSKHRLYEKITCNFEEELTEEELTEYKSNKAVLTVKTMGMMLLLPGLILIIIALSTKGF